jgi:hypothetical protein
MTASQWQRGRACPRQRLCPVTNGDAGLRPGRLHLTILPLSDRIQRSQEASRGDRPVALDETDSKNRKVIERRYHHIEQWQALVTRYDPHAVVYRAAVVLNAIIAWTGQGSDTS